LILSFVFVFTERKARRAAEELDEELVVHASEISAKDDSMAPIQH
jgi:hypothetical protein